MIEIRRITKENARDLRLKNEPFTMPGRMVPSLKNGIWDYEIQPLEPVQTMTFPDEDYDYDSLDANGVILGAYRDDRCVGIAIYQEGFFKYMYLYDLKVCSAERGKGIGRALIEAGLAQARARGYEGLYTQAQDNNVNACLFYLKTGFQIGGFDNRVYAGTSQADKGDIIFYMNRR